MRKKLFGICLIVLLATSMVACGKSSEPEAPALNNDEESEYVDIE